MSASAASLSAKNLRQRGLIVMGCIIATTGALFVYGGNDIRTLLGTPAFPTAEGNDPIRPNSITAVISSKSEGVGQRVTNVTLATHVEPGISAPVATNVRGVEKYPEQLPAEHILRDATKAFADLKWDSARISAERIACLEVDPKTQFQARDLVFKATIIGELFRRLSQNDEMVRNLDTNPNLVEIVQNSDPIFLVPLDARGQEVNALTVDYIQEILRGSNTGFFALIRSRTGFIKGQITGPVKSMHLVDQNQVRVKKESEYQQRYEELTNRDDARNPLAWYELAKFSYHNRLDGHVPQLLENAIKLDPLLVDTVREDCAGRLLVTMQFHMKNHNKIGADSDYSKIRRDYADTANGKRAAVYYAGGTSSGTGLTLLENTQEKQTEAQRQELRLRHAQETGDLATIAEIQQSEHPGQAFTPSSLLNATSEQAAQAFASGMEFFTKAVDLPSNAERNHLYRQAHAFFSTSVADYNALVTKNPSDETLQEKMTEAKLYMAASSHYQTEP